MDDVAICTYQLGKRYRLGTDIRGYGTLREGLARAGQQTLQTVTRRRRSSSRPAFWALRDLSLTVRDGEIVGLIGHNGAGKTTLLKILSRITEPSSGYADVRGRVGSLLEVGTGFHPELTGRENIFLNGAILGMRRAEIRRRFDEIVAFSEIERFLDTPVKRYSSGMSVRLAFAVAAHLEPEILLVDEVLAVGDAAFQRKSLGKMGEVASQGRTVIFVSHNLAIIQALCQRGVLLQEGRQVVDGPVAEAVGVYLRGLERAASQDLLERTDRDARGYDDALVSRLEIRDAVERDAGGRRLGSSRTDRGPRHQGDSDDAVPAHDSQFTRPAGDHLRQRGVGPPRRAHAAARAARSRARSTRSCCCPAATVSTCCSRGATRSRTVSTPPRSSMSSQACTGGGRPRPPRATATSSSLTRGGYLSDLA